MEFDNGAYIQYKRVKKIKENMNNSNTKYMNTRILNENILLERKENNHPYNQIRCVCVFFFWHKKLRFFFGIKSIVDWFYLQSEWTKG